MHSRFRRLYEQRPGRQRTVYNVNRQHGVNGVIDAATGPAVAPDQVLTGAVIHHIAGINANSESLGITSTPLAGPLAEFPALEPAHAIYTTDQQLGLRAAVAAYGCAGALPPMNFPLHNKEGFVVVVNNGSTFIQTAATLATRTRQVDEYEQSRPQPTRFATTAPSGPEAAAADAARRQPPTPPAPRPRPGWTPFIPSPPRFRDRSFPLAVAR